MSFAFLHRDASLTAKAGNPVIINNEASVSWNRQQKQQTNKQKTVTSDKVNERTQTLINMEIGLERFFFHFEQFFYFFHLFIAQTRENTNHAVCEIKKHTHTKY